MKEIKKSLIAEINRLHSEILNSLKMSLEKAIKLGELLTKQKDACSSMGSLPGG